MKASADEPSGLVPLASGAASPFGVAVDVAVGVVAADGGVVAADVAVVAVAADGAESARL